MKLIFLLASVFISCATESQSKFKFEFVINEKWPIRLLYYKNGDLSFILNNIKTTNYKYKNKSACKKYDNQTGDSPINTPRFRFAPSPTGFLHVGGCRTFLYNYILAKQMNGKVIFRLEDTDTNRNTKDSLNEIIKDLKWMNLDWDEGPYKQSENMEKYKKIAHDFVKEGKAYYCFCTKDELNEKKEMTKAMKKKYIYDRKCRYLNDDTINKYLGENKLYAIRFKSPIGRKIVLNDILKNNIEEIVDEDFIILRSNFLPTYNFAVSVDDHLMKISHVIRGVEHISNTFKQILVIEALNGKIPYYAHMPVITNLDKKKISKRNNEYLIKNLREEGFKPECVVNYLGTLGWSPISTREFYTLDELIEHFNIHMVNKSSVVFNMKKLKWMNKNYLLNEDSKKYLEEALKYLFQDEITTDKNKEFVELCISIFKNDVHDYGELKKNIIDSISYDYMGNDLNSYGTDLKQIAVLLCNWFEEYKDENINLEDIMGKKFNILIEYIWKNTKFMKKNILLRVRILLTFQKKGIPFINLLKIWLSAQKNNIQNYVPLSRRLQYIKSIFNI
ncbi:glutamate--tRNA ligase [Plasmodium berghei]|uniref:glutamate--tRNA ligase n=2 Tax=Plasmodium berghei TaxID=5821 RepID=A0A509AMC1_PLABA|nr:glutamate--tRNA ligase [Plasmodium berghei ANKA]CXI67158.1 glutamate--tRNA ligase [Plasmodium berghei]SCM24101.1 glutamate--tRNA ligase [Plasmodium berghei]SCN26926.1 glutamate--tRNA ligase [Plasmodium berghei]SCO61360.1 glutamate--tRNA ligase [Plasmodium berghei]SCO63347.1 glutamate--tRNA ligase [Plasmodium berghei]|eukprot:XP_034422542.1 glutamate--tRNA ligase [Plasmodium berghei ANKA]